MIFSLLGSWWFWIPIVSVLLYLTWRNYNKVHKLQTMPGSVLLMLEIPRANDKKELAAEQMFASLHGILRTNSDIRSSGHLQEHMSFEFASIEGRIRFYVWVPEHLQNFLEGQIYAQYPTVQIYKVSEDYADRDFSNKITHTTELSLTTNEILPLKTFPSFEVDPLAAITATLAKLEDSDEELWVQVIARPIDDNWHRKSAKFSSIVKKGGSTTGGLSWVAQVFGALWKPPEHKPGTTADISERDKSRISAAEEKSRKLGYRVKIRMVYIGRDKTTARLRMQAMVGTYKQFNSTNLNGFVAKNASFDPLKLLEYRTRFFIDRGFILNIEELASVFHLPHTNVETPNILWATSKTAEPPANLPVTNGKFIEGVSPFGISKFRGSNIQFGIKRADRGRHLYIIGQTGTGKSGLLELLTMSDIFHNQGFALIDPHGDYAINTMKFIPENRIKDVIYFNPADTSFPIGFNPMEVSDPAMKSHISSELVGVLKRMFESWGPRLEYILRYTILALLDYPGSTMLDITRMLTDKKFRDLVIRHVDDPVVRNFWTVEFASWNDKFAAEAVAPVLNKVGAFVANPMVRNIVGQPKSTFNVRKIMDEGKILIVNLSRGLMGEDNSGILGALMVTKIQLAAMSRADIANVEDRRPFYLYVDEFQNFATDSFAVILSEARKYGLNLTVANQYTSQMPVEVKDAVFGNVGSMISFRVGAEDAPSLKRYFDPQFDEQDLQQLNNRSFVATLSIDGEKAPAFSGQTLQIPKVNYNHSAAIIESTRKLHTRPLEEVKAEIAAANSYDTKDAETSAKPASASRKPSPKKIGQIITGAGEKEPAIKKKRTRRGTRGGKNKLQATPTATKNTSSKSIEDSSELSLH